MEINKTIVVDTYDSISEAQEAAIQFNNAIIDLQDSGSKLGLTVSGEYEIDGIIDGYKLTTIIKIYG